MFPWAFFSVAASIRIMIATWIAHETDPHALNSFSIGFEESNFDEMRFAEFASESIGTAHHTRKCDRATVQNTWLDLMKRLDEPVGDPAILPTFLVSKLASEHVTVSLSGDGGDELFAGYDQFPILKWAQVYDKAGTGYPASCDETVFIEVRLRRRLQHEPRFQGPAHASRFVASAARVEPILAGPHGAGRDRGSLR